MPNERIVAKAEMLIRRPVNEVFAAFVDPAITSKFWFSRGSDKLEAGRSVRWQPSHNSWSRRTCEIGSWVASRALLIAAAAASI
jgi:uncharacterized protein YndB with AHSA1/START domain